MHQLNAFVSSTCYDLKQIRKDLQEFISVLGHHPIMSEFDSFPIDPSTDTIANCIRNVESADIFILVIGGRYGYVLENGKSITNMEYIYAKKKGIPVLVYIKKEIITGLSLYEDNPEGNFKSLVDNNKVFDFVNDVRAVNQHWSYDFEHAQDITDNLKIRLSHLFSDSLALRSKMQSDDREELWKVISPKATAIAIRKEKYYEMLFFIQVLRDELDKFKQERFDVQYQIYIGNFNKLFTCKETSNFLRYSFHEVVVLTKSAGNIMNNAYKFFWGEPGVPADLYGLYYVCNRLAKVYAEMIRWSVKVKCTDVVKYYDRAKHLASEFNGPSSESIWNYPDQLVEAFNEMIYLDSLGSDEVTTKGTLLFTTDELIMQEFQAEMDRLGDFFSKKPELYT